MYLKTNLIKCWILILVIPTLSAAIPVKDHCDIPGHRLRVAKARTPKECAQACEQEQACKAFIFISGWNRCELKSKTGKQFNVKIAAGFIDTKAKERSLVSHGFGWDNTGKDYLQKKEAQTLISCESACYKDERCHAFAFIDGYSLCWLKKNNGKKISKVFYCGVKGK